GLALAASCVSNIMRSQGLPIRRILSSSCPRMRATRAFEAPSLWVPAVAGIPRLDARGPHAALTTAGPLAGGDARFQHHAEPTPSHPQNSLIVMPAKAGIQCL